MILLYVISFINYFNAIPLQLPCHIKTEMNVYFDFFSNKYKLLNCFIQSNTSYRMYLHRFNIAYNDFYHKQQLAFFNSSVCSICLLIILKKLGHFNYSFRKRKYFISQYHRRRFFTLYYNAHLSTQKIGDAILVLLGIQCVQGFQYAYRT